MYFQSIYLGLEQPSLSLDDFENTDLTGLKLGIDWTFFKVSKILSDSGYLVHEQYLIY